MNYESLIPDAKSLYIGDISLLEREIIEID